MSQDYVVSIIGSIVLIPFVDWVVKKSGVTDEKVIYLLAIVSSIVVGVIAAASSGQFQKGNMTSVLGNFATVFVISQSVFKLYWQNSLARETFTQRISPSVIQPETPVAEAGEPAQSSPESIQA